MRRLMYLLILTIFVSASVTCVSASTDCERWFVAYRSELAHTRSLQRIAAAKRRARQRLAGYTRPAKPRLIPVKRGPAMTRHETLRRVELACGVLPESVADAPVIAEEAPGDHPNDGVDLLPAPIGDLIAEDTPPPPPFASNSNSSSTGAPIYNPGFGGIGGGGAFPPPPPPPPPPPVVPEPSSYVFMLTGLAGIAARGRRAFKV